MAHKGAMNGRIYHLQADTWDWKGQGRLLAAIVYTSLREPVNLTIKQELKRRAWKCRGQSAGRRCQIQCKVRNLGPGGREPVYVSQE